MSDALEPVPEWVELTAGRSVTLELPTLMDLDVSLLRLNLFRLPARAQTAAATVLGLIQDGDLDLPMTRFRLDDLASAVESLAAGETVGRVVVLPTPGHLCVPVEDGGSHDETAA
ncbi:MAG TPA: hypothetical protein VHG90_09495 [Acidimicrobiales bacterium]|nr:hypothetical protein [Acidimicrobiales bacterium]